MTVKQLKGKNTEGVSGEEWGSERGVYATGGWSEGKEEREMNIRGKGREICHREKGG